MTDRLEAIEGRIHQCTDPECIAALELILEELEYLRDQVNEPKRIVEAIRKEIHG